MIFSLERIAAGVFLSALLLVLVLFLCDKLGIFEFWLATVVCFKKELPPVDENMAMPLPLALVKVLEFMVRKS